MVQPAPAIRKQAPASSRDDVERMGNPILYPLIRKFAGPVRRTIFSGCCDLLAQEVAMRTGFTPAKNCRQPCGIFRTNGRRPVVALDARWRAGLPIMRRQCAKRP